MIVRMIRDERGYDEAYDHEDDILMPVKRDPSGNEYILDDFPCSGPTFMGLSNGDRNIVTWAMTERSVLAGMRRYKSCGYIESCLNSLERLGRSVAN